MQLVLRPQGGLVARARRRPAEAERLRDYRAVAGRISSGTVRVGDRVEIFPSGIATTVTGIRVAGVDVDEAVAPAVGVARSSPTTSTPPAAPSSSRRARSRRRAARSTPSSSSSTRGRSPRAARVLVKHGTATVQAIVAQIESRYDLDTPHARARRAPSRPTTSAACACACGRPAASSPTPSSRHGGSFLVIHPSDGATLAAGIARD